MASILSEAFEAHPVYIDQNQVDLTDVRNLPESYVWGDHPCGEGHTCGRDTTNESIPLVDLAADNVIECLRYACRTWGAFQLTNHCVPDWLLAEGEDVADQLFSLPLEQKLKAARSPVGVAGYGRPRISSFFNKLMWSEGFTVVGSPLEYARLLFPDDYTEFCDMIEEYQREMKCLAVRLTLLLLASLDITGEDDVGWCSSRSPAGAVQLNFYPCCPDPDRAMGLAPHTDSTFLTILHQNGTAGLQVLRERDGWVLVPSLPGALVIVVGDLLHIISNGLYPSVFHRAVVNATQNRISIAYLHGPPPEVRISPHPKLVNSTRPALFGPMTWTEYLSSKAKYFNHALTRVQL